MDTAFQSEKESKKYCKIHSSMVCTMIHLDNQTDQHYICSLCIKQRQIPYHQTASIAEIINFLPSPEIPIFSMAFLADIPEEAFQQFNFDEEFKNFQRFFEEFFQFIKAQLSKIVEWQQNMIDHAKMLIKKAQASLFEQASINSLKQILVSQDPNAEKPLHDYLQKQYSSQSIEQIQKNYDEFLSMKSSFSLDEPKRIQNEILSLMENITSFNFTNDNKNKETSQWHLNTSSCLPCSMNKSDKELEIKLLNNQFVINSINTGINWRQFYLTKRLKPKLKYIIKLSLKNETENYPLFYFGLINNNTQLVTQGINYSQYYGGGNTQIIKGNQLHSSTISVGTIDLEFWVCIEEQLFKVSSFPDYKNVVALKDKSLIVKSQEYFFAGSIFVANEQVIIKEVQEVLKFDGKM